MLRTFDTIGVAGAVIFMPGKLALVFVLGWIVGLFWGAVRPAR
jgi:hypothetical protein